VAWEKWRPKERVFEEQHRIRIVRQDNRTIVKVERRNDGDEA
jgi:hypothetical protein